MIDNVYFLEKEFMEFISINSLMVLFLTFSHTNSCHNCVSGL